MSGGAVTLADGIAGLSLKKISRPSSQSKGS
jgi:hypothetical protein